MEFVIVNGKEEANLLRVENMTSRDECEQMLDGFGMTDEVQRNMYREAMQAVLNALQCRMPDTSFFKIRERCSTKLIEFLNDFRVNLVLHRNMLLAAASEGLLGNLHPNG